jgi:hypothetical protein
MPQSTFTQHNIFFSFPIESAIEQFLYYKHVLHLGLHMIKLVFVYKIYLQPIRENMQTLCFWAWFTLLSMISSNCIHLPSKHMSFFLLAEYYSLVYKYHIFFIQSWGVRGLGCFQSLAIVNRSVVNVSVQISLLYLVLHSFG